jgi:hypothetical protein
MPSGRSKQTAFTMVYWFNKYSKMSLSIDAKTLLGWVYCNLRLKSLDHAVSAISISDVLSCHSLYVQGSISAE